MEEKKLIDFYELTMAYCDFKNGKANEISYFDVYFRKNLDNGGYNISGGLDEIIDYILNLRFDKSDIEYLRSTKQFDEDFLNYLENFKFSGDIYAIEDGTAIFPNEPIITVKANCIEAQLLETDLLNRFNHATMIATKSRRIVEEAKGRAVMEFGARRAQGGDGAVIGAKYAYIAGAVGSSCYETGKRYGITLLGTMAHSHIMKYNSEYDAFLDYAKVYPNNAIFLVDTIDTLKSGVKNAIAVAKDYLIPNGYRLKGIRLDSGDLAYLSKQARKMLDDAGLQDCQICVSNALDEYLIKDLLEQNAPIDSFGVGENLITSKNCPVFSGVYKLAMQQVNGRDIPKIKISENVEKITNPAYKKVYRFYDKQTKKALGDLVALASEDIAKDRITIFDEKENWKQTTLTNYEVKELQVPIFINGELVYNRPSIEQVRAKVDEEMSTLWEEIKRLSNPHKYYVDISKDLLDLKQNLIWNNKSKFVDLVQLNSKDKQFDDKKQFDDRQINIKNENLEKSR
ncbi:MAG: nicotinate phosphoribosyltransferase [Christensenellales bacterium]